MLVILSHTLIKNSKYAKIPYCWASTHAQKPFWPKFGTPDHLSWLKHILLHSSTSKTNMYISNIPIWAQYKIFVNIWLFANNSHGQHGHGKFSDIYPHFWVSIFFGMKVPLNLIVKKSDCHVWVLGPSPNYRNCNQIKLMQHNCVNSKQYVVYSTNWVEY